MANAGTRLARLGTTMDILLSQREEGTGTISGRRDQPEIFEARGATGIADLSVALLFIHGRAHAKWELQSKI